MSDELDARRQRFEELSAAGGPLTSRSPQATVSNREWFGDDGRPSPARADLQQRIVDEFQAEARAVPTDRQAVIIAGPPGAGRLFGLPAVAGGPQPLRHVRGPTAGRRRG
jgi:hypothetical protein